jgi:hypothetical protein
MTRSLERLPFRHDPYLPTVTPTEFNYPVAIYGKWHGNKYRFITRYRSDRPDSTEPEFEHAFARIDFVARDRLDLLFHRIFALTAEFERDMLRQRTTAGHGRPRPWPRRRQAQEHVRRRPEEGARHARPRCLHQNPSRRRTRRQPPHAVEVLGAGVGQ